MTVSRMLAVGALVCLIGGIGQADEKTDYAKAVVGKWEVSKADPGTVPEGALIEFTKDGKIKITAKKGTEEMVIEGTYKVDGNKFTFAVKLGDMEHKDTITITKISDKEMSTKDKDDKVVVLKKK
jgi:uncharacterized protein (TIGR03066 family)